MRLIVRLFLIALGLMAAIAAGTIFLMMAAIMDPVVGELASLTAWMSFAALFDALARASGPDEAMTILAGVWTAITSLLAGPPVLAALIGEVARIRSFVWYGGMTGLITAALPWALRANPHAAAVPAFTPGELRVTLALFLTGALSGLVYWLVAGRTAGPERREPLPVSGRASPES